MDNSFPQNDSIEQTLFYWLTHFVASRSLKLIDISTKPLFSLAENSTQPQLNSSTFPVSFNKEFTSLLNKIYNVDDVI